MAFFNGNIYLGDQYLIDPDFVDGFVANPTAGGGFPATYAGLTFSAWFCGIHLGQTITFESMVLPGSTYGLRIVVSVTGGGLGTISPSVTITAFNGSAANLLTATYAGTVATYDVTTPLTDTTTFGGFNLLISLDAAAGTTQIYANDVALPLTSGGWVGTGVIRNTGLLWAIYSYHPSIGTTAGVGAVWIDAAATNLSVSANRRGWIEADLSAAVLPGNGQVGAVVPLVYLDYAAGGVPEDFVTNGGSGGAWASYSQTNGLGRPVAVPGGALELLGQAPSGCLVIVPYVAPADYHVAIKWFVGGSGQWLRLLAGDYESYPYAANSDGSVILGRSSYAPVRWDGSVVTALATIPGVTEAHWLSRNGQTIFGADGQEAYFSSWTSGGTVGSPFAPLAGYLTAEAALVESSPGFTAAFRCTSDDGTVVVGNCTDNTGATATDVAVVWTNGVPVGLPSSLGGTLISKGYGCSTDGSVVFGIEEQTTIYPVATYWTGTTSHPLTIEALAPTDESSAWYCNAAGTIIYGEAYTAADVRTPCYWDSLGTTSGGRYGVQHFMSILAGGTSATVQYCSETGTVAVGYGTDVTGFNVAIRWNGTVATNLGRISGGQSSFATGCSADGSVVSGWSNDASGNQLPVYWDVANVLHQLPLFPGAPLFGKGLGVSRDGSVVWGLGTAPYVGVKSSMLGKRTG